MLHFLSAFNQTTSGHFGGYSETNEVDCGLSDLPAEHHGDGRTQQPSEHTARRSHSSLQGQGDVGMFVRATKTTRAGSC